MARFCGKCGNRLDKKTGLCLECDKVAENAIRKKYRIRTLSLLSTILLLGGLGFFVWHRNQPPVAKEAWAPSVENTDAETRLKETELFMDAIDVYFQNEIISKYPQQNALSIQYRSWCYKEENSAQGVVYYDTDEGPLAIIGTSRADYNRDGVEDLLVVSLDAEAVSDYDRKMYNSLEQDGLLDGLCTLLLSAKVHFFDKAGETHSADCYSWHIAPTLDQALEFSRIGDQLVICWSYDGGSDLDFDKELYFPVTSDTTSHFDAIWIPDFVSDNKALEYRADRNLYGSSRQETATGVTYNARIGDESIKLYYTVNTSGNVMYHSEEEACEYITSQLLIPYGVKNTTFKPTSWKTRWEHTFLSGGKADGFICSINLHSDISVCSSGSETNGSTTIQIGGAAYSQPEKGTSEYNPVTVSSSNEENTFFANEESFALLPRQFDVCGSSHATGSVFNLNPDGTFTCDWIFWDWGDWTDEYPEGTCQISKFRGKFSDLVKIDEYTYKLILDYSEQWDQIGREYVENNKRYIVYDWDRFEGIEEVYIYLPGTKYDFNPAGVVSLDGKELFDLPANAVDWEDRFAHGCVLHIDGMPAFICEDYDPARTFELSSGENILASTLDFSQKWSYFSQYRVYKSDSESYLQDYRACFTFSEDGSLYLLVYEPYSDVYFGYDGSYSAVGDDIEFTIYYDGESWTYLYRFDPKKLTLTQLSEEGLVTSIDPKGTVHQLEVDPSNN